MAPTPAFRISKNSATGKKMTTTKHEALVSSFESLSEPFTSKTGTKSKTMELDHASETQITNTIRTKYLDLAPIKKNLIACCDELLPELIHQSTTRGSSLFLELLHSDVRHSIYDALVNSDHEVIINPTNTDRGPISALSSTCHQINNELKQWATGRKDLTFNPTFGLINLSLTTFRISWSRIENYTKSFEKFQRCYTPEAAKKHLPQLELWQRAMSISKSCTEVDVNDQVSKNPSLQTIGPVPKLKGSFAMRQGTRVLWLNNHDSKSNHDVKDFIVLDPKKFKGEEEAPQHNKLFYFGNPYVWSSDWKHHVVKQEFAFRHPKEGGVVATGLEAAGWEPIRRKWGWDETFGYERSVSIIQVEQGDGTTRKRILFKWTKVGQEVGGWRDTTDRRHSERESILKRRRDGSEILENLKEKMSTRARLRGGQGMDIDSDT